jgi:ATP-dependent helicase HepA
LLSATPTTSHYTTHLGLLHLLDPDLYPWERAQQFAERYERRIALADSIYSLDARFSVFLESSIQEVREILGESDPLFEDLAAQVLEAIDENGELRSGVAESDLAVRVEELRAHLSETYRLHRRIIRHRRATVLTDDLDGEFAEYEVRGRRPPVVLSLDSEAHEAAESHLLEWQREAADHLVQEGVAGDRGAYGSVLRVLASRTGVVIDDLLDSLRWRIRSDRTAADRAGLTTDERRTLRAVPPLPFEPEFVLQLEKLDDGEIRSSALDGACRAVASALRKGRRAAFFCGPGQLSDLFAAHLRRRFPKVVVGTHTSSAGPENAHDAVRTWSAPIGPEDHARLLVLDGSGEDGLNLQLAHSAVHLRLPWSPNQLEQRLGRLDRYRSVDAVSQSAPAEQYRLSSAHGETSIGDAWAELLTDGYEVFDKSVSPLQDAIVDGIDDVWTQALDLGPAGLHACTGSVLTALEAARLEIEKMDLLESIHDQLDPDAGVAGRLNRFETDWVRWRTAFHGFTSEHDGGVRVRHRSSGEVESYDVVNSRPSIDPHHWRRMRAGLTPAVVNGVFNRSVSLRKQGVRLLRSGNALTDALAEWAWQDDRGLATAFSRPYVHQTDGADPYFGFDYLVSADTGPAVTLSLQDARVERALRRQADRLLPPFIVRVWVPAFRSEPVVDDGQRQWLDRPYDKNARDRNYSGERLREFFDIFGGQDEYQSCLTDAERTGRAHMAEVTDLHRRCSEAQAAAEQRMAIARAQAKARSAAGHLVGDVESYLVDTEVTAALVGGLSRPSTQLIAAVCVVRVPGVFRGR